MFHSSPMIGSIFGLLRLSESNTEVSATELEVIERFLVRPVIHQMKKQIIVQATTRSGRYFNIL